MSIGYDDTVRELFESQSYQFAIILSHMRLLSVTYHAPSTEFSALWCQVKRCHLRQQEATPLQRRNEKGERLTPLAFVGSWLEKESRNLLI
jgi:hypothetical protein